MVRRMQSTSFQCFYLGVILVLAENANVQSRLQFGHLVNFHLLIAFFIDGIPNQCLQGGDLRIVFGLIENSRRQGIP
jgi:hypothetical protein